MKIVKTLFIFSIATVFLPRLASADMVGNYTPDANTLFLLHMDEPAGTSAITNYGSKGGVFYTVADTTTGNGAAIPPVVTTMLGAQAYVNGPTNFGGAITNPVAGYMAAYDYNGNGFFEGDVTTATPSPDRLALTNLNMGFLGQSPFTMEALIRPTQITANQEIICTDNSAAPNGSNTNRGFQFRITASTLQFQAIGVGAAISGPIPATGADAFAAGNWYHVAVTYDGAIATLYWTKVNPANGAAHVLNTLPLNIGPAFGLVQSPLIVANEDRGSSQETFLGSVDEVRISSVCRAANQMQFYSPLVTITQNPVSQNVDYNQPVTFSVGASSLSALGYRWRFNSNSIPASTNSSFTISNVAAGNAGYYDVIVTNTFGYAATSSPALLVVGAANFLTHRWSFTSDTSDSIGGAWGTNSGNATVSGGKLVLDGTTGTYMQMPGNLFNGANASALTLEFWATFGVNASNAVVFDFGLTNGNGNGFNYVSFTPHSASGNQIFTTTGDVLFQQAANASGNFDNLTMHIACVVDPPNQLLSIYTNGVLEVATNFTVNIASLNDQLSFLGHSLFNADPYLVGSIDEFRIFGGALSAISIRQSESQGPNTLLADGPAKFVVNPSSQTVPIGQFASFTATAVGYLPITYQWFKNGSLVPGATNTTFSFLPTLADNNSTIFCQATNIIGVTTYITNSSTATLGVFVPPTLSWLGPTDGGQDNSWNTTSLDWTNDLLGGGVIAFNQTNAVVFDDRSGGGVVDLEQSILPFKITVNATSSYQLTSSGLLGSLTGPGTLIKQNSGTLQLDLSNNLSGPVTVSGGELQIGNNDSSGSLGGGPVTNNAHLSINRGDTVLNVGNSIHGSGTLSFDGFGAVTLSGNSDYSGATLLNSGFVYLTSPTGLGATAGVGVANGAQLYLTANINVPQPVTLNGAGDGNGALRKGGAGTSIYNGAVTLVLASTIGVDSGATLTLSNVVSGLASLTAVGSGTLVLSTNNSFNGGFTLNGPVVDLNATGALGSGPVTVSGSGRFVLATGMNFTNFLDVTVDNPGSGQGILMVNDNTNGIVTTISGPLEFDASPVSGGDFVGPLTSGYLNVTGPLTNTFTGNISSRLGFVRFSGGGNYTLFTLNGGTASLGANNGLCSNATLTVGSSGAAVFDLNGFSQALTGLTDGAVTPNSELVTNSGTSPGTLTLNLSGANTYSGVIAGNIALVENGAGNMYLAGTNTYTGNTTINGGTLELAQPGLGTHSTVTVTNGAILQLDFATTNQVSALITNGISAGAGIYNSANASPYVAGSGYLLVVPGPSGPAQISASLSGTTLGLSWPAGQGWRLVSQTNSLSSGLNSNPSAWSTVSGAGDGSASITVDRNKPAVFYQLVYP